jgi:hypothetical protein
VAAVAAVGVFAAAVVFAVVASAVVASVVGASVVGAFAAVGVASASGGAATRTAILAIPGVARTTKFGPEFMYAKGYLEEIED